ncbi:MAG TPA: DNA polymerase III subunit beta [Myxococcota bacterium]|jgi:DNA polymerase-3 subunit beta
MKLSIAKAELQRGLGRIQSIVEKRNTMPILANVLLEARKQGKEGFLDFAATDLEVAIRGSQIAQVDKAGRVTASAKKLYEIVRELPDETVRIEASNEAYLTIRCARAEFTLAGASAEEYPTLPSLPLENLATVQAPVFAQMIERTMYASSADETRYNLNGVYLELIPETHKIRMVATDGHRLAYVDRSLGGEIHGLTGGVIIPRKALGELKRLLEEEDADELELGFQGNSGIVRKKGVTLTMRLIEGEFPSYRQVIPREAKVQLVLAAEPLGHALRRVAVLSTEQTRAVKLELSPGLLKLSSSNPDLGQAQEELDVDYAGEPVQIAFNARYLLDAIAVMGAKELRLSLQDPLSPARIVPTDDEDTLAVVMPMRA